MEKKKWSKKKRGAAFLLAAVFCLGMPGCGKKEQRADEITSVLDGNLCLMEEGALYVNSSPQITYFDYGTKEYRPLCARPNCLHDSLACEAVYLRKGTMFIGRAEDRWYYLKLNGDFSADFYSCSLDGSDERKIGDFSHLFQWAFNKGICYGGSCITATYDTHFDIDEKTGDGDWTGTTSGIYRYHFDTGEAELLCPEKELLPEENPYEVYGIYKNLMVYSEWDGGKSVLRIMDLTTGEISEPAGDLAVSNAYVGENLLACSVRDGKGWKILEYDMDSGKLKEIMETDRTVANFYWTPDVKLFDRPEDSTAHKHPFQLYRYTEEDGCELFREGKDSKHYFMPKAAHGDMLLGYAGEDWKLSCMDKEDFLAGKDNWTVLSCE